MQAPVPQSREQALSGPGACSTQVDVRDHSSGVGTLLLCLSVFLLIQGTVNFLPALKQQYFCQPAAAMAAVFLGARVTESPDAFPLLVLPGGKHIHVSEKCSGADFFSLSAALFLWIALRHRRPGGLPILISMTAAYGMTLGANSCRIIVAHFAERWGGPMLPPNFAGATHFLAGMAVFLPCLLAALWLADTLYEKHILTRTHPNRGQ